MNFVGKSQDNDGNEQNLEKNSSFLNLNNINEKKNFLSMYSKVSILHKL